MTVSDKNYNQRLKVVAICGDAYLILVRRIMMNGDAVGEVVDDAVGILYMINPVMARKRLGRVNVWHETLPQASSIYISYSYIRVS
ncbi:MAG: hypothetical protein BHV69_00095 [Bacteroidales bacterium 52_46]|nr:MAG: hypothetical protein BHV69_00095 [Bacteroidales bacterium 52_46]